MNDLIGHALGRYHILEKLGEGGMAVVYKAYDTHLEHEVAVKVIRLDNLPRNAEERALKRFEREAKAVARLDHPNLVKVTDYGEYEGNPYLVMPYVPGGTLKEYLKDHVLVDWREAASILLPVAQALAYAHEQGLIHRDVKPSNILLSAKGWPMLTDFGVAKVVDDEMTQDLTGTSATVGTPEYMAPEQVMSKTVDHRADIYALGVVFYEMVTGRRPYEADTPMAVLVKHASAPLPRPRDLLPGLPDGVEHVLLKALAKQPEDRYQDMSAFAAALQGLERARPETKPVEKITPLQPEPSVVDQFATVDQVVEEADHIPVPPAAEVLPQVNMQTNPVESTIRAGGKLPLIILAGVTLVALLVIGIISGRFAPQRAAVQTPAPSNDVSEGNTIGSTQVSDIDSMTMVYVPAGEFLMGSPEGVGMDDEHPQHTVYLDAYWIDQTEVTNAMFAMCVKAGSCIEPASTGSFLIDSYFGNPAYADYPVIFVRWDQAQIYCEWAGRQLPTEAQWEKAARGTDGRIYPWGSDFNCKTGNYNDETEINDAVVAGGSNCDGYAVTAPVGNYPTGASPYGALDMAGNVWEWVEDWYDYYPSDRMTNPSGPLDGLERIQRGGSWLSLENNILSAYRGGSDPIGSREDLGFRCAISASENP